MNVLADGRRMAEARMTDTCIVSRDGAKVWNETTGEWVTETVTVFSGPCRIKSPGAGKAVEAGAQLVVVSGLEAHLPIDASGVQAGDVLEVTASLTRDEQVGRAFRIVGPFDGSQTTALRFRVEAIDPR